ncbi:DUF2147 domain-containing protein [Winogradskyella sp. PE311]|uniref:DUF2147 domain-containing protein n=1 Tax=Winogradskyella sp. PE311 TaxID=3366943 RepID=UPI003980215D
MNRILVVLFVLVAFNFCSAQDIFGKWKTIDDETGKEKSIVEIYKDDGKVYGKIVELINPDNKRPICSKCQGEKKDQPIIGMIIIEDLEKDGDVFEGGTILNPKNGKIYKCRLKLEANKNTLQVRGYVSFFYKTQYWQRVIE